LFFQTNVYFDDAQISVGLYGNETLEKLIKKNSIQHISGLITVAKTCCMEPSIKKIYMDVSRKEFVDQDEYAEEQKCV
jgi:hypothetical protein